MGVEMLPFERLVAPERNDTQFVALFQLLNHLFHVDYLHAVPLPAVLPFHDFAELLREQGRRQHIEDLYNDGNVKGRSVMRHSVPSDTADLCTRRYASTNASCPRSVVSRDNFHSREGILKHAATVVAAVAAVGELAAFDLRGMVY